MKRLLFVIITLLYLNSNTFSQSKLQTNETIEKGKILGRMIDSISGQPIEYATIGLFTQIGNKVVNGTTTNEKGFFKLINISEGTYKMVVDFIGYKRFEKYNIIITKKNSNIVLGDIKLSSKQTQLNEVVITADKSLIEYKIDKMVYNADKDVTSQSGVASDLLKKVPQVSVNVDGNVELQGNSNIKFLINGKPSVLFGNNVADILRSIPASQIQSIEVITSPGAKYDAEGTGGIINIILKQNNTRGVNGNASVSAGTRLENASFNLNVRRGNFGINGYISANKQLPSNTLANLNRTSIDTITSARLLQDGVSTYKRQGMQSGFSFDWDITKNDNITGGFNNNYWKVTSDGSTNRYTNTYDEAGLMLTSFNDIVNTTSDYHQNTYDVNLNYKHKFNKKDQVLEVQFNTSDGDKYNNYNITQKYITPDEIYNSSYGINPGYQKETNLTLNYTHPVNDDFMIEAGAKSTYDHIYSNSDVYLMDIASGNYNFNTDQSSLADYKRYVYAGYLSATFKIFKMLDVKAGIRDEYTVTDADFSNAGNISFNPYNTFVPSIMFSHTFKNKQSLRLSYSHRIQRPDYGDLNPFINASDPKNLSSGNPNLAPEKNDKIELGYNQTLKNGINISANVFCRGNRDDIQSYTNFYPTFKIGDSTYTNVSLSTRQNIGREDNIGISIYASIPINDKINIRTNLNGFQRYINTGLPSGGDVHGFNYRANINATYQITNTLVIEMFGNFNSPRLNAQGKMPSFTSYNFALRKQFFNKNASIAFTANNFLSNYVVQNTELTGQNFFTYSTRQLAYRSIGINLTYKFGHMEFKKEKEEEEINLPNPTGN